MIKSICIHNFQSHKDTVVDFSQGLNCIIGTSNVGKSSIVRALRWVLFNDTPKEFISWGENSCYVSIVFDNGYEITRGRDKSLNYYRIVNPSEKINKTYENFGLEVPQEIKKVCETVELGVDVDKILNLNVVSQHDPLFLLNETGTTRSKAINSLSGIHYVDSAIRTLIADTKSVEGEKKRTDEEIKVLQEEINQYKDIPDKELRLVKLKVLRDRIKEKYDLVQKYNDIRSQLENFNVRYENWAKANSKLINLPVDKINRMYGLMSQYKELKQLCEKIESFSISWTHHCSYKEKTELAKKEVLDEYKSAIRDLKTCPICHSEIDENKVNEIVEKL